tara:strand:+ start:1022 stop:1345 length:324 start_codon:yes stop_codon:yes gene_type:complete
MRISNVNPPKHLSLILVLSFLVLHKIYLVMAGIIIALLELNKNYIINLIEIKNKSLDKEQIEINRSFDIETKKIDRKRENNRHSLVEKIEELGYIPSIEKENDTNAA